MGPHLALSASKVRVDPTRRLEGINEERDQRCRSFHHRGIMTHLVNLALIYISCNGVTGMTTDVTSQKQLATTVVAAFKNVY